MSAIPDLMAANLLRVFNEQSRRRRAAAIRAIYAKGVHHTVERLQSVHPGFVFQPTGLAVAHHGLACQRWRFGPREARDIMTGVDVAFFEKGSIKALIRLR